ncbi:MAG: hypothetical protein LBT92_03790 [Rickettsiales bacterium]|jgi:hypothetical protein|nr:hypothetical protein [Rickettsiales bacterium]
MKKWMATCPESFFPVLKDAVKPLGVELKVKLGFFARLAAIGIMRRSDPNRRQIKCESKQELSDDQLKDVTDAVAQAWTQFKLASYTKSNALNRDAN